MQIFLKYYWDIELKQKESKDFESSKLDRNVKELV